MGRKLLLILTVPSIFGLTPSFGSGAPQCSKIFEASVAEVASIQDLISLQLTELKATLLEFRQELKSSKGGKNRLKTLQELKEDPREIAYILQGAYRLILAHPEAGQVLSASEKKSLEKGLRDMKWLEKTLGTYSVQVDLLKTAKKIKAADDFVEYLTEQRKKSFHDMMEQLKDHDFLDKEVNAVSIHIEKLKRLNSLGKLNQQEWVRKSFQSELDRVREKVETEMKPLIQRKKYGYIELEEGAHAFRRSLRWLRVYLQAYSGYFYTRESSPFSSQPSSKKLELDVNKYRHLIESIEELRKIKKPGEMQEKLAEAVVAFGFWNGTPVNGANASLFIHPLMTQKFENIEQKTQEILELYEAHDGFRGILKATP